MKLKLIFTLSLLVVAVRSNAQWTNTTNINNTNSGSVGIGTTSSWAPGALLDVRGTGTLPSLHLTNSGTSGTKVELMRLSAPGGSSYFNVAGIFAKTNGTNSSQSYLSFSPINTNGSGFAEGLTVHAGGNVGIGGIPASTVMFDITGNKGATANRNFRVTYPAGWTYLVNTELSGLTHLSGENLGLDANWTALYAKQGTHTTTYAAVINGKAAFLNDNVGIGTADPKAKLHVSGGNVILEQPVGTNSDIFLSTASTDQNKFLRILNSPTSGAGFAAGIKTGGVLIADDYNFATPAKNNLVVKGYVGVGTSTPLESFQIGDRWTFHNSGHKVIGYNSHNASGDKRINDDEASAIRFDDDGNISFQSAPSGAAASAISWISGLTIKNSGDVDLGREFNLINGNANIYTGALRFYNNSFFAEIAKIQTGTYANNTGLVFRTEKGANGGATQMVDALKLNHTGQAVFSDKISLGASTNSYTVDIERYQSGPYQNNLGFIFSTQIGGDGGLNVNHVAMTINHSGNVGIGTGTQVVDAKLAVNGNIHAKEVLVDLNVPGPDYVFEADYDLLKLKEVESYLKENKHLPEVPSAKEMEANGVKLLEMNMLLLKKVEELTLYVIELEKKVEKLANER
jgi:hypothetical protein